MKQNISSWGEINSSFKSLELDYFALACTLNEAELLGNNFKHFFMSIRTCKLAAMN